jgi:hypothetical protein
VGLTNVTRRAYAPTLALAYLIGFAPPLVSKHRAGKIR